MKRALAGGAALTAVLASLAAAAAPQVTMFARPSIVGADARVTLFGSVASEKAEEIVTIQAKDCGSSAASFQGVVAARTQDGGSWSVDYSPRVTTTLRAVWGGNVSAPVTVRQRALVYLAPLAARNRFRVMVGGKVQFWRKHVLVQRFDRRLGTWSTVKSVVLTETGGGGGGVATWAEFEFAVAQGALLRAVFPLSQARPCYLAGSSRLVRT